MSLSAIGVAEVQDFNTLASTATSTTTPVGWEFAETGTNANSTYTAGTGGGTAGDTYSFGSTSSVDRAFGTLQSGTLIPTIGAVFTNNTGQTITSLEIAYTGEQWRIGTADRLDRLDFQYSLNATSLASGTWIDADALDFAGPTGAIGARDGNADVSRRAVGSVLSGLSIAPGTSFRIRWADFNATGADDGLAIDDFSITPLGGGATTISVSDVSVAEGNSGTTTASFSVTVSSASHSGVTFDIATADGSGAPAATVGDGDYVSWSESAVTLPAGTTSHTFDVTINGDTFVEPDERFFVRLANVSGAAVARAEATGTITNDDEPPPASGDVVISQVYGGGGNAGATLTNDFVELFNRGTTPINLTGWSVQYVSSTGTGTWAVTTLTGTIEPGRYYLVQEAQGTGGTTALPAPQASGTIAMAAGAGKVALQVNATPIVGACPSGNTADLVGYGGANCFEGAAPASALSNTTAALRKRGGCFDSNDNRADFSATTPQPRNAATRARSCTFVPAAIHDIQGSGAATPFDGLDVVTSGIVTGIKSNGFFLQAPDGSVDADQATSEGLFVFTSSAPAVAVGTEVSARGTAGEFFNLTQLESSLPGDVTVLNATAPLPSAVALTPAILDPAGTADQLERFEAMRVQAASLTSVGPTNEFGEIAAVLTGVPRPMREPGISVLSPVPPDPTSGVPDCCIPRYDENPERILVDTDGLAGSVAVPVTSTVVMTNVAGPLDFTFDAYKILPESPLAAGANMSGVPVPAPAAGEFMVGGFNIENFAGDAVRRSKAALAIRTLMRSPDVIGHIEIRDLATLQGLADQINSDAVAAAEPNPQYQAVLIQAPAGGTQNVGFLVRTSRVRIDSVTQERGTETFVNPTNGQNETLHDRPPLVLRATVEPSGLNPRPVIVVVNHMRSFIDIELVGGEGPRVRAKRKAQAESTAGLLQELQTLNPGVPVISIGDYNAYQFNDGYTDPIAVLKGSPTPDEQLVVDASPDLVDPDFVNLTDSLPADQRYSFIFEGTPQALDHMLVNTTASAMVQRYAIARGNSDFPEGGALAADPTRPERSSDHDMPVAYFRFPPPQADLAIAMTATPVAVSAGGQVTYTVTVVNNGPAPASHVIVSDTLPTGLSFVSCAAVAGGVCGGTGNARTVSFPLLAPGASATATIAASVGCSVTDGFTVANLASVSAETADPEARDNTASALFSASNQAPAIAGASVNRTQLLLPLHQMVPVTVNYTASDSCGPVTTTLSVTSNEPVMAPFLQQGVSGLTSPDWVVVNAHRVDLRAERSVRGTGRIYTIRITATDAAGTSSTQDVIVTVPFPLLDWFD